VRGGQDNTRAYGLGVRNLSRALSNPQAIPGSFMRPVQPVATMEVHGMPIERLLKTLHSWLGLFILPWVIVAGLTGLYMNHEQLILSVLPVGDVGAGQFIAGGTVQTEASARVLAEAMFGDLGSAKRKTNEGRPAVAFKAEDGSEVLVDLETGHLWQVSRHAVTLHAPDGQVLAWDWRWSKILSSLHRRGWVDSTLGTWLADITASALMVFGTTGLILVASPRVRRWKNRRARLAYQRQAAGPEKQPAT
jgi:hypothetical protein